MHQIPSHARQHSISIRIAATPSPSVKPFHSHHTFLIFSVSRRNICPYVVSLIAMRDLCHVFVRPDSHIFMSVCGPWLLWAGSAIIRGNGRNRNR